MQIIGFNLKPTINMSSFAPAALSEHGIQCMSGMLRSETKVHILHIAIEFSEGSAETVAQSS